MNLIACARLDKSTGELISYTNGRQELEVNLADINTLSDLKVNRLVGIDKEIYKLSAKSYTQLKKELNKANLMWRIGLEKKA